MSTFRLTTRPRSRPRASAHGAYWFLLPNTLGFLLFTLLPVLGALLLSLFHWDPVEGWSGLRWAAGGNYVEILGFHRAATGGLAANDPLLWYYLYNTAFLLIGVPVGMALSLFTALLLNQKLRGIVFWRALFFVPTICSSVAVAVLWKWIYQPDGLLNTALGTVGVAGPNWLGDPAWAKPALILMGLWVGVGGYNCVLYLAGLQNIPRELYEAAAIDGAGFWTRLRYITWPQLAPTTFFILVMSVIGGLQGHFVAIHIMTAGGPANSTTTLLYYIYQEAFEWHRMGYAAALAVILFVLILGLTLLQWKRGGRAIGQQF
jgi:multiple sugar transport system permease protein